MDEEAKMGYTGREELDAISKLAFEVSKITLDLVKLPKSREKSLAITKLQEGVMWLEMDQKRLFGSK